jgi:hypothetical protein
MVAHNITLDALKEYLNQKYNIDTENISRETSLLYDLEMKGDDVDEFFSSLITDFRIDVRKLDLSRFYVGEEPFDFLSPLIRFFKKEHASNKPTITIGNIQDFIQTGILE